MNFEDAEEYTQSLGQIVGGSWRQIALANRLGVPKALGHRDLKDWVTHRLGGYVKMNISERREAVAELTDEGLSSREIEGVVGVDHSTIARDVANATPENKNYKEINANEDNAVANATTLDAVSAIAKTRNANEKANEAELHSIVDCDLNPGFPSEVA